MLRAERLFPQHRALDAPLQYRRFRLALGACYRAPWRLPGPDLHRLANTNLHGPSRYSASPPFKTSRSLGTLAKG
jgi:hypothetical protein